MRVRRTNGQDAAAMKANHSWPIQRCRSDRPCHIAGQGLGTAAHVAIAQMPQEILNVIEACLAQVQPQRTHGLAQHTALRRDSQIAELGCIQDYASGYRVRIDRDAGEVRAVQFGAALRLRGQDRGGARQRWDNFWVHLGQQGERLMPDAVAQPRNIVVGGVFAIGEAITGQVGQNLGSPHPKQRSPQQHRPGGHPILQCPDPLHPPKAFQPRAREQVHHNRFSLVLHMMCDHDNRLLACRRDRPGRLRKKCIAQDPCRCLQTAR